MKRKELLIVLEFKQDLFDISQKDLHHQQYMMGGESAMLSKHSNSLDTYHTFDSSELSHFSKCQFLHFNWNFDIYSQLMMQCVLVRISDDPRVQEPLDIDLKWTPTIISTLQDTDIM